ncbi:hypothetical protein GCM10009868_14950 [Terrabacter aerolatus]|uniref:Uncharacterized protein n=1 Tax=Terrabacter aerolatus TaxID=422442 RepID=A0A512D6B2_9MICO|nr:hypothetical protein [Terrabacter aerolatus]GEO32015.1 hypothetical protein TAE01_38250 [Terrabacter aerolatus]
MVAWAELSGAEREVMMLASEESPLWELAVPTTMDDEPTRPPMGVGAGKAVVRRLMDLDLVCMFRPLEPQVVMSSGEVEEVMGASLAWDPETGPGVWVSLHLTAAGEELYYLDVETS